MFQILRYCVLWVLIYSELFLYCFVSLTQHSHKQAHLLKCLAQRFYICTHCWKITTRLFTSVDYTLKVCVMYVLCIEKRLWEQLIPGRISLRIVKKRRLAAPVWHSSFHSLNTVGFTVVVYYAVIGCHLTHRGFFQEIWAIGSDHDFIKPTYQLWPTELSNAPSYLLR